MADLTVRVVFNRIPDIAEALRTEGAALCERTADAIVDDAKSTVAVRTGETRDSIHREGGGFASRVLVGGAGLWLEYGTRFMHAHPFFHPAVEKARQAYIAGWHAILAGTGQRSGSVTTYPFLRRR